MKEAAQIVVCGPFTPETFALGATLEPCVGCRQGLAVSPSSRKAMATQPMQIACRACVLGADPGARVIGVVPGGAEMLDRMTGGDPGMAQLVRDIAGMPLAET